MINLNRLHFCFMVAVVIVSLSNAMEGNDDSSPHMFNMNEQPPLDLLDPTVFDNALGGQASQEEEGGCIKMLDPVERRRKNHPWMKLRMLVWSVQKRTLDNSFIFVFLSLLSLSLSLFLSLSHTILSLSSSFFLAQKIYMRSILSFGKKDARNGWWRSQK